MERNIEGLSLEEAQRELEFLTTKCFISGYKSRLLSMFNSAEGFFNTPEQEEENCRIVEECLKRGGSNEKIPRRTSEDYRRIAEESYDILRNTYEDLPWNELRTVEGAPKKGIYEPMVYAKTYIDDLEGLISNIFFDPKIVPPEYLKLKDKINILVNLGDKLLSMVLSLKGKIKQGTNQEPVYPVAFEVHEGYSGKTEL